MKKQIIRIQVTEQKKDELYDLINKTIEMVELYKPQSLQVIAMLGKLKAMKPEIDNLRQIDVKPVNKVVLKNNILNIRAMLVSISNSTSAASNPLMNLSEKVAEVKAFIKLHYKGLPKQSDKIVGERSRKMLLELEADVDLKEAIAEMGLKGYFDKLKLLVDERQALISATVKDIKETPKVKTKPIKVEVLHAMGNLLDAIELAKDDFSTSEYLKLVDDLNTLYVKVRSVKKAVSTRKSNAAALLNSDEIQNETTVESSGKTTSTAV